MSHIESLLKVNIEKHFGWQKLNEDKRVIRIGNQKNCNDDNLICNPEIKNKIEEILKKNNIDDYILNNIVTEWEFSYELILSEEQYNNLKNNMCV